MKRHIFKAINFPTKTCIFFQKPYIPGEQAQHEAVHGGLRQPQGHHAAAEQAAQVRCPLAGGIREAQRIPSNYHYYKNITSQVGAKTSHVAAAEHMHSHMDKVKKRKYI